ncbi:MAG: hypothetical protein HeimC3_32220 [Candidatus Heimdallarchaeota archaeon LC_3]|nr:MAG: hypothetical protein HeimC3_32220 [Candidatus Heimdallarchaeota archaeon LC_3]
MSEEFHESKHSKIRKKSLEILEKNKEGIRFSELANELALIFPDIKIKTIKGGIWNLDVRFPNKVIKPEKGLFKLIKYQDEEIPLILQTKLKEDDFYEPFSKFIVEETLEATEAMPLGGSVFKDKWGTPDVIGVRKTGTRDVLKIPTEIISAEIKLNPSELIKAFGQACAYRLFSHKVYLVIPISSSIDELERIDSLCLIFGIGLVLFDSDDKVDPKFVIKNRPQKFDPDIFYTNSYIDKIEKSRPDLFKKLFPS